MKVVKLDRTLNSSKVYEGGTSKRVCSAIVDGDSVVVDVQGSTVWREKKEGDKYASQTDAQLEGTLTFTLAQVANLLVGKFLTDVEGSSLEEGSDLEVSATYGLPGEKAEKIKGTKKDAFLLQAVHEVVKTTYKDGTPITLDNVQLMLDFLKEKAPETSKSVLSRARALRSAAKPVAVAEVLDGI